MTAPTTPSRMPAPPRITPDRAIRLACLLVSAALIAWAFVAMLEGQLLADSATLALIAIWILIACEVAVRARR